MNYIQTNIIWFIIALVVLWIVFAYNSLIRARNRVKEAWSDISIQLKRRYDLIPNIVETVKGYAQYEKSVFEEVTNARTRAMGTNNKIEKAEAENQFSATIKTLFAVAENYPDLKANANFLELQRELSDTENKIQASRRFYNSVTLDLNTRIQVFPTNVMARMFGFKEEEFFALENDEEKNPVKVSF
jgi:LemA protein